MLCESSGVLVTGASGYIASHIVQQLLERDYAVRGTVRSLGNEARIQHLKELCPDATHKLELVEADLENEESWKSAVDGCSYVLHTASPFPLAIPNNENDVINPAVEGVTNVLKAVAANGKVKRVVVTSAGLAICGNLSNKEYSEKDWPDNVDGLLPYPKSKTLAEKAAWDFVENLKDEEKFELVVVHPVGVVGPILSRNASTSTEVIKRLLLRNPFLLPKVNLPLVDVRDVAAGHIAAMKCPEAAGNRHILCGGNMWWNEMGSVLRAEFKSQGYNVPTMLSPKIFIRMASPFMKETKMILPIWNKVSKFDNTRMVEVLKIQPRDLKASLIDMAYSLIEAGIVKKTPKYRGPGGVEPVANGDGEVPAVAANGPTTEGESKPEETKTEEKTDEKEEGAKEEPKSEEPAANAAATDSTPAEKTEDKPADEESTPAETPAEAPAKTPAETSTEAPAETKEETPVEAPTETPAEDNEKAPETLAEKTEDTKPAAEENKEDKKDETEATE
ncbi:uncharacterized protein LOC129279427 [Lytechinus pictus]|uniref:uncharacterized protein LOC129279427 n=1 Tax=Lytechinus pictus TaxID=7653 RepID=UPI0030BA23EF